MQHALSKYLPYAFAASFAIILGFSFTGCASSGKSGASSGNYSSESWRDLIPASCVSYFDGCNNCTRNPQTGDTACTRKACTEYYKPRCLDGTEGMSDAPQGPRVLEFRCNNNKRFTVFYGNYIIGDKTVRLPDSQAVFVDGKTRIAEAMTRQPSASGEKYVSGELTFWLKDGKAVVDKGHNVIYANCTADGAG